MAQHPAGRAGAVVTADPAATTCHTPVVTACNATCVGPACCARVAAAWAEWRERARERERERETEREGERERGRERCALRVRDGAAWQLPFALLPVLHFTSSRKEMGEFRNSTLLLRGNDMVLVGMTLVWLGLPL